MSLKVLTPVPKMLRSSRPSAEEAAAKLLRSESHGEQALCETKREVEGNMGDTSITKVDSTNSARGEMRQKYLASGTTISMRLWADEQPEEFKPLTKRDYETVGYVIKGKAELRIEGQVVLLEPGDSWVVPRGSTHAYRILEPFTAVEATSPPAFVRGRDEASAQIGKEKQKEKSKSKVAQVA
jgi:quercetin dioxygenase-like cupin family protein